MLIAVGNEHLKKRERKTWKSKVVKPADAQPARRGEIEESPFAIFVDLV